ncbi:efflux RND transporter periplasmic adaptor subunit [Prolixibacteraceae bacterium JC049]|nr:efflux RND transporter periplasmic adaptor subunit [Prolixibacteraceae bacterium JC049]
MKRQFIYIAAISVLLGITSCGKQDENEKTELAVPVSVEDLKVGSIKKYVNTTGTALAAYDIELKTEIAGRYQLQTNPATNRPYKLGDKVKKGDVIIRLEDKEYENSIAIDAKKLDLEINEQENKKQKSLYEKGGVTLREMRNSEVQLTNARYGFSNAQLKLEKMAVVAPFDGVIVELPYFTPNTKIASGQSMVKLMDYSNMYMEINLPEKSIVEVKTGQHVNITNYTLPEDTLKGVISELSPAISTETRTFKGKLKIENPRLLLRPGMFVKADIEVDSRDSVLVIPKRMIISSGRGKRVFVVEKSAARERRIKTGLENQDMVEVKSGLKAKERLVVKGFETLRNGSKVKILK